MGAAVVQVTSSEAEQGSGIEPAESAARGGEKKLIRMW